MAIWIVSFVVLSAIVVIVKADLRSVELRVDYLTKRIGYYAVCSHQVFRMDNSDDVELQIDYSDDERDNVNQYTNVDYHWWEKDRCPICGFYMKIRKDEKFICTCKWERRARSGAEPHSVCLGGFLFSLGWVSTSLGLFFFLKTFVFSWLGQHSLVFPILFV